jgi:hypothetical protein
MDTTCAEGGLPLHGATPNVAFDMHGTDAQMQKYLLSCLTNDNADA